MIDPFDFEGVQFGLTPPLPQSVSAHIGSMYNPSNGPPAVSQVIGTSSAPPPPLPPRQAVIVPTDPTMWEQITNGYKTGLDYALSKKGAITSSVLTDRMRPIDMADLLPLEKAALIPGRVVGDVIGNGTRSLTWGLHPERMVADIASNQIKDINGSRFAQVLTPYAATLALGIGSGNYDPSNLAQGGRSLGYAAASPDQDDPRNSVSPLYDLAIERGILGHKGRLLPWEQFHAERPDVSYESYNNYKDYIYNKNPSLLSKATLGIVKGTVDGINGPEISLAGYNVTPVGAMAALGTIGASIAAVKYFDP